MNRNTLSLGALILLAVGAFGLNVSRAERMGVFRDMPGWVVDAIPAALTQIHRPDLPRYTIATKIRDLYYLPIAAAELNARIATISAADLSSSTGYVLLGNDDKGIVDFVEWAFRLLGPYAQSIPRLYYGLLGLSVMLFIVSFRNRPVHLAAAACVLFASYQVLPYTVMNSQLGSPLALRCMPLLSLVACLHVTLQSTRRSFLWTDALILAPQALLIVAVIHMRMTAMWQVLPIVSVALGAAVLRWRGGEPVRLSALASPALSVLVVLASLAGLSAYRNVAFSAEYQAGQQIMTRVKWHNVYSGFALNPTLARERDLRIDDASIVRDVGRYLERSGKVQAWREMGGETENFSSLKWAAYDQAALDALRALCIDEPARCLTTFLIYKPYHIASCMLWFYGLSPMPAVMSAFASPHVGNVLVDELNGMTKKLRDRGLSAAPWAINSLLFVALLTGLLLLAESAPLRLAPTVASMGLIAAASLAPSILGYPAPHAMVDSVASINAALQFGMAVFLSRRPWLRHYAEARSVSTKRWFNANSRGLVARRGITAREVRWQPAVVPLLAGVHTSELVSGQSIRNG